MHNHPADLGEFMFTKLAEAKYFIAEMCLLSFTPVNSNYMNCFIETKGL